MNIKIHLNKWLTLFFAIIATPLLAAEWNAGGGTNTAWTNDSNWVGSVDPAGTDVLFTAAGITNTTNPPSNVVDANISILSLTYQYTNATNFHTTEILSGVTLNVGGTSLDDVFLVGGITNTDTPIRNTSVVIKGEGALNISQDGGSVTIANHRLVDAPNGPYTASLDMRELATFSANLGSGGSFNVGTSLPTNGPGGNQIASSTVYLASENSITAGALLIGSVIPNSQISIGYVPSSLYLGVSNELNVDVIRVGRGHASKATGYLGFDPSVLSESPEVVIRGLDGVSAVSEMKIGVNDGGGTSNRQEGEVDFSGGNVDALISSLIIGSGANSGAGTASYATGSLTMDQGIITASNVIVGSSSGANTASTNIGILNIEGGAFHATDLTLASRTASVQKASGTLNISGTGAVTVTNGIVMGSSAAGTDTLTATVNVDGGSLLVHDNIAKGSGSGIQSTLNLRGGNLNLGGNSITVDTFNVESGTLQNVSQFNAGADLVKTTAGTLLIAGTNTWTGGTVIEAGTANLSGSLGNGKVTVENSAQFNLLAAGTLQFNITGIGTADSFVVESGGAADFAGALIFDLDADYGDTTWTLFTGTSSGDFGSLLGINVTGAFSATLTNLGGNLWGRTVGDRIFEFDASNGEFSMSTIPEPHAFVLVTLGSLAALARRRRR